MGNFNGSIERSDLKKGHMEGDNIGVLFILQCFVNSYRFIHKLFYPPKYISAPITTVIRPTIIQWPCGGVTEAVHSLPPKLDCCRNELNDTE